jgi:hypothetical protein
MENGTKQLFIHEKNQDGFLTNSLFRPFLDRNLSQTEYRKF